MHFSTLASAFTLALLPLTQAMQIRIGGEQYNGQAFHPYFIVFNDSWQALGDAVGSGSVGTAWWYAPRFCSGSYGAFGCPNQVSAGGYGIRVTADGGSDGAIRVEQWKGSKSQWTWCKPISGEVYERGHPIRWQCDFKGY